LRYASCESEFAACRPAKCRDENDDWNYRIDRLQATDVAASGGVSYANGKFSNKNSKILKIPGTNEALIDASQELLFQSFIVCPFSIVIRQVSVIKR